MPSADFRANVEQALPARLFEVQFFADSGLARAWVARHDPAE